MSKSENAATSATLGIFPAGLVLDHSVSSYEELCEVASFWQMETRQLQPGRYSGRLDGIHSARAQLAIAHHGLGTCFKGSVPKGTLVVSFPINAGVCMRFRGQLLEEDCIAIHNSPQGLDACVSSSAEVLTLCVEQSLLTQRAASLWQTSPKAIASGILRLRDRAAAMGMRSTVRRMLKEGLEDSGSLASDAEGRVFEERVLDAILFPLCEPRPVENSLARNWMAKRASSLLEECFREPIGMVDLCSALRASRRTLHAGFLEVFGIPPMRYLQILRLNAVRSELQRRRTSGVPVTRIATDCGFSHLGRFSVAYREFFGVSPSQDFSSKQQ